MSGPSVAILPWGDVAEDWLDDLAVRPEELLERMAHGWIYGYMDALRRAGGRGVLVLVSRAVDQPRRVEPEGAPGPTWLLPQPLPSRVVSRAMIPRPTTAGRLVNAPLWRSRPYLSTPLRRLAEVLRQERCTAMLCQEYEYARSHVCVALGRAMGVPVFLKFGGMTVPGFRLVSLTRGWAMRGAAGFVIAASEEETRVRERYGVEAGRIARIGMPVDASRWRPRPRHEARARLGIPQGDLVVAWHGRVEVHIKGLDMLLDAWSRVGRTQGRRLHLLGSGREASVLRRLIEAHGGAAVHWRDEFVPDTDAVLDFLGAADVYATTSRWEGQPLAVLEAMACGLPVLATTTARSSDLLRLPDGRTAGIEVAPTVEAIAAGLERLLRDEGLRRAAGAAARAHVEQAFDTEVVGRRLVSFLAARAS